MTAAQMNCATVCDGVRRSLNLKEKGTVAHGSFPLRGCDGLCDGFVRWSEAPHNCATVRAGKGGEE